MTECEVRHGSIIMYTYIVLYCVFILHSASWCWLLHIKLRNTSPRQKLIINTVYTSSITPVTPLEIRCSKLVYSDHETRIYTAGTWKKVSPCYIWYRYIVLNTVLKKGRVVLPCTIPVLYLMTISLGVSLRGRGRGCLLQVCHPHSPKLRPGL